MERGSPDQTLLAFGPGAGGIKVSFKSVTLRFEDVTCDLSHHLFLFLEGLMDLGGNLLSAGEGMICGNKQGRGQHCTSFKEIN